MKKPFVKLYYDFINSPELKTPAEKIIYSIIFSFTQERNQKYIASLDWLQRVTGVGHKDTLMKYLRRMVASGLLEKVKLSSRKVMYRIGRYPEPTPHPYGSEDIDVLYFLEQTGQL